MDEVTQAAYSMKRIQVGCLFVFILIVLVTLDTRSFEFTGLYFFYFDELHPFAEVALYKNRTMINCFIPVPCYGIPLYLHSECKGLL